MKCSEFSVLSSMFRVSSSRASSPLLSPTATSSSSRDLRTEPSKSGTSPQVRPLTPFQRSDLLLLSCEMFPTCAGFYLQHVSSLISGSVRSGSEISVDLRLLVFRL